jgi:hypothetical protein
MQQRADEINDKFKELEAATVSTTLVDVGDLVPVADIGYFS